MRRASIFIFTRFIMFKTGLLIIYIGLLGVGAFPAALEAFEDTRYAVNTKIKVPWLMADYIGDF